jgi:hypothetical protein
MKLLLDVEETFDAAMRKKNACIFFLRIIAATGEKSVNVHIGREKNNDRDHPLLSVRLNMPSVYIDR